MWLLCTHIQVRWLWLWVGSTCCDVHCCPQSSRSLHTWCTGPTCLKAQPPPCWNPNKLSHNALILMKINLPNTMHSMLFFKFSKHSMIIIWLILVKEFELNLYIWHNYLLFFVSCLCIISDVLNFSIILKRTLFKVNHVYFTYVLLWLLGL